MSTRMQTAGAAPPGRPTLSPAPPRTHGLTVLGWVVVCFSSMPITMGLSGDGAWYGRVGVGMLLAGVAMVAIGRRLRRGEPG
jgi:hypothetical protein